MNENDIKNLKDLQFTITKKIKKLSIEIITTRDMLDEHEFSLKDRKLLKKYFEKLKKTICKRIARTKPVQVAIIRSYLSSKKEIDK